MYIFVYENEIHRKTHQNAELGQTEKWIEDKILSATESFSLRLCTKSSSLQLRFNLLNFCLFFMFHIFVDCFSLSSFIFSSFIMNFCFIFHHFYVQHCKFALFVMLYQIYIIVLICLCIMCSLRREKKNCLSLF